MFTPGAEVIKDKKVLQSIGFIGYKQKKGSPNPEETSGLQFFDKSKVVYCKTCGFSAFVGSEYNKTCCPICNTTFDEYLNVATPEGFRTDFQKKPKDFDGTFDGIQKEVLFL